MKVHNLLEDLVSRTVEELFDEEEASRRQGFCTCHQCRLDVMCYVLNRLPPRYTISGRGLAHRLADYQDQLQMTADLVAVVNKGIQTVSATMRPQFAHADERAGADVAPPSGPVFSFPVIEGRVLNGGTFEPVFDVAVLMLREGRPVPMIDANWENPYSVSDRTAGSFYFWPAPIAASGAGITSAFELELSVASPLFEELHRFIKVELNSVDTFSGEMHYRKAMKIDNLMLFPAGTTEEATG